MRFIIKAAGFGSAVLVVSSIAVMRANERMQVAEQTTAVYKDAIGRLSDQVARLSAQMFSAN